METGEEAVRRAGETPALGMYRGTHFDWRWSGWRVGGVHELVVGLNGVKSRFGSCWWSSPGRVLLRTAPKSRSWRRPGVDERKRIFHSEPRVILGYAPQPAGHSTLRSKIILLPSSGHPTREPPHQPLQILAIVRPFHDLPPNHTQPRLGVKTGGEPVHPIPPDSIKINKQNASSTLRQVQHVRLSQVTKDRVLFVKQVESLGDALVDSFKHRLRWWWVGVKRLTLRLWYVLHAYITNHKRAEVDSGGEPRILTGGQMSTLIILSSKLDETTPVEHSVCISARYIAWRSLSSSMIASSSSVNAIHLAKESKFREPFYGSGRMDCVVWPESLARCWERARVSQEVSVQLAKLFHRFVYRHKHARK